MKIAANQFTLIAKGSNSSIYHCNKDQIHFAIKTVEHSPSSVKQIKHLKNQFQILKTLTHPNIIKVFLINKEQQKTAEIQPKHTKSSVLILEHAPYGSLLSFYKQYATKMQLPHIRFILYDIASALEHLHSNFIVHRDIKLDNILVFQEKSRIKPKIADFGFATSFYQNGNLKLFSSLKGTRRGYMAPQIHETANQTDESEQKYYDARNSDIFALVFGMLPFEYGIKTNKIYKQIAQRRFEHFWSSHIKQLNRLQNIDHSMIQEFKDLFEKMVCYNPKQRLNIQQVLNHDWFKGLKFPFVIKSQSQV